MKVISLLLSAFLLLGCVTTQEAPKQSVPDWFNDPYSVYSSDEYILYTGSGNGSLEAEYDAKRQGEKFRDVIEPVLLEEYSGEGSKIYVLFGIKISELNDNLNGKYNELYNLYFDEVLKGDSTSNILQKYSLYKKALKIYDQILDMEKYSPEVVFNVEGDDEFDIEFLNEKFEFTGKQIEFSVNVTGDIDSLIKDSITEELHRLGYVTSESGIVQFNGKLTLKNALLDNDYINKYWSITLSISDIDGYSSKSLTFKGRESQLSEEALNQSIARSIVKHVRESLNSMLP